MGSKRFRGQKCVYCSERPAVAGDHVFAREFFVINARDNLPQVPVCDGCNNEKSRLEHYLTAILPFGGQHADARQNLVSHVPARLAKNLRLHQELHAGRGYIWRQEPQVPRAAMTLPVEQGKICALFGYVARGLAWFHWSVYLEAHHVSKALLLSRFGCEYFSRVFGMNAARRVQNSLGNGTIEYVGVQGVDMPQLTLWRIRFYGGIEFAGDPDAPDEIATEIAAITGTRRIVAVVAGGTRCKT
jgi:hypothetical protein